MCYGKQVFFNMQKGILKFFFYFFFLTERKNFYIQFSERVYERQCLYIMFYDDFEYFVCLLERYKY